jgi:assimilatory nitrate reductase catalytic subunit
MWERLSLNRNNPALVVVDPRRTETAAHAREHLAIRPKSDLVLLYALAHVLIREGWIDHGFIARSTTGFEAFARHVSDFTPARASIETGVSEEQLLRTAQIIGRGKAVSYWWTMGVNQSHEGVRVAQALINLALITGQIGRPGAGANSITGQCNAMGSRLVSNTTNLIGGYDFKSPDDRRHVASCLGIDPALIPDRDSWAYPEIIEGVRRGQIKALWIIATNTAHSWMDQNELREVWGKLDFLVVQDMYHSTETARLADLLLPAAGWGEKDGTIINSERRVGLLKKVSRAPGVALADFAIFKLIARYWGCDSLFEGWDSPEHAFRVLQRLSEGKPWDITGIDGYAMLDRCHGVQWPFTRADAARGDPQPERRLFADGVFHHPDGRARLIFEQPRPMPEPPSDRWPFVLLTGRGTASQWHTQTRTAKSAVLRSLYPAQPYVEVHPDDAQRLDLKHGEPARVSTPRGAMTALAMVTPTVQPGQLFIPMHYPGTNLLTRPDFDPYSRQPSYKACAARIEAPVAAPSDAGV